MSAPNFERQGVEQGGQQKDEPPPILGSWTRVYTFVLGFLVLVILTLYAFMRIFS
jgi:hypothetical protein